MFFQIIVPAALWLAAFWALALVLYQSSKRLAKEGRKSKGAAWLAASALAMGGAAVPSTIQFMATDGKMWWAGAPLGFIALALAFQSVRQEKPKGPAFATFKEKSAAVSALAILLVYGWATWNVLRTPPELADAFGFLIGTSILMAVVMALTHTVMAIIRPPEKEDERDLDVGLRATRNGHWVMTFGVWGVLGLVFVQAPAAVLAYALMGIFVLAEFVRYVSELAYYRLSL
jgi:hypothetical protein